MRTLLLAIDIGNTNIVFGVNENGDWKNHWRIQTDALKTADEYEVIFRSLLEDSGKIGSKDITQIVLSSVVPSLVRPFSEMLTGLFPKVEQIIVNPDIYDCLPVRVINPYEIGTDLVANAVAAFQKYGTPITVVDFGTALTFTTVGENAEIKGVAIAPGFKTAVSALAGNTAQLPQIHLTPPPSVLGKNTVHAIQAGIIFGFTGLIDTLIEKTEKELNKKIKVVATGGLSATIAPLTKDIKIIEPLLTLDGLYHIHVFVNKNR